MLKPRGPLRDLLILAVGAAGGYWFALYGRSEVKAVPQLDTTASRIEQYMRTHPNEMVVGAALLGVILFLLFGNGRRNRPPSRGRR